MDTPHPKANGSININCRQFTTKMKPLSILLARNFALNRRCAYPNPKSIQTHYSRVSQTSFALNHDRKNNIGTTRSYHGREPSATANSSLLSGRHAAEFHMPQPQPQQLLGQPRRFFATNNEQDPFIQDKSDNDNNNNYDESEAIPSCLIPYAGIPSHPDVIELEIGQRLVAIGDVHGDFEQLLNALLLAGVVSEELDENDEDGGTFFAWVGGNTILVQIGDVLDRGPNELPCWQLLAELSRQAETKGGRVINLYGNHELWTSIGFYQLDQERYYENLDYDDGMDDHFEAAFGHHLEESLEETESDWRNSRVLNDLVTNGIQLHPRKVAARWAAMEPGGLMAKHFLSKFKIAVQVGETLLVHAGMVPEHLDRFGGITGMNEATRHWILKQAPRVGRTSLFIPPNDPEGRLRSYLSSMPDFFMEGDDNPHSPIWMRDYSLPPDEIPHNPEAGIMLDEVLRRVNASRIVIGHTPQSCINAALNGKAWRIDVGMSRGMNGTAPEVLEIVKDESGDETIWVLTNEGRIPAAERHLIEDVNADHPVST